MSGAALDRRTDSAGCFGKLPQRGDFVQRDLDAAFVDVWDGWLQGAVAATRDALGDLWLDRYLTAPVWCYVVGAQAVGARAHAGVLAPSVDRVGRCYPITIAAPVTSGTGTVEGAVDAWRQWLDAATGLILDVLAEGGAAETFLEGVCHLGRPPLLPGPPGMQFAEPANVHPVEAAPLVLDGSAGLWWTDGSDLVAPCRVLAPVGLPPAYAFAAFLDGDWAGHGWARANDADALTAANRSASGAGTEAEP